MHRVLGPGHLGRHLSGGLVVALLLTLPGLLGPGVATAVAAPDIRGATSTSHPALPWTQADKLLASDGGENRAFGADVSIDGDRLVVGEYGDVTNGDRTGAAYVYERSGADWVEVAKLVASDGVAEDLFGYSVGLSGDRIVVGAFGDDDNGDLSGSAYVFERNASGSWIQVDKVVASDAAFEDRFGASVDIDGDRIAVGATDNDDQGSGTGSTYVYERDPSGQWLEVDKLLASDATADLYFGQSVAVTGGWIVVGAFGAADAGERSGAAYVFERGGAGGWSEVDRLVAADPETYDYFGYDVAASGDRVVVGAFGNDDHGERSGSAYVYERDDSGDWIEADKLVPLDGAPDDNFGRSVGISAGRVVAGSFWDDDQGLDSGSAYVFERNASGDWIEADKLLASDGLANALLGHAVAISDDRVVAGAISDTNALGPTAGAAYVFEVATSNDPPTVAAGADAPAVEGVAFSLAGSVVDADDPALAIAWTASPGPDVDAGATCTFVAATSATTTVSCSDDGTWTLTLTADDGTNPPVADSLTLSVSNAAPVVVDGPYRYVTTGDTVDLAWATFTDAGAHDSHTATVNWGDGSPTVAVVVTEAGGAGTLAGTHSYAAAGLYFVGVRVVDDDHDQGVVTGDDSANTYIFVDPPIPPGKVLPSDDAPQGVFGYSVSISGDAMLVGAYGDRTNGENAGAAYVFERNGGGTWIQSGKLLASDGSASSLFGYSVAISGDRIVVGAHNDTGAGPGAAYVFERDGFGVWSQVDKLVASDAAPGGKFGYSVAIAGDRIVVGSQSESAYVFERDGLGDWLEVDRLQASDAAIQDYFGSSVAIAGDRVVVGAQSDDNTNGIGSGAAYVFERDGGGDWLQADKLVASDGEAFESFGQAVAIDGGRIVVGSISDDDNGANSGSAYIFERDGTGDWIQADKLIASDGAVDDLFGYSLAIAGGRVIVNGYGDDDLGPDSGSAYVFERSSAGDWLQVDKLLAPDGAVGDHFGQAVAISGDRVVTGAYGDTNIHGSAAGAVYVFELSSLDSIAPAVTIGLPVDGSRYTQGDSVFASYVCDDGAGSGVGTCVGAVPNGAAIDTATLGFHTFAVTGTDVEGNSRTTSVTYDVMAAGDTVDPQAFMNRPANGAAIARYAPNVVVAFSCTDTPGSGIASCTGTQSVGSIVDTTTPGTYSFTVTAIDLAGNVTTLTTTYTVLGGTADTAVPYVSVETPVHLARYATGSTHLVSFSCTDSTPPSSGVATCAASVPNGSALDTSVPGTYAISFYSVDNAGNVGTNFRQYQVVDDRDGDGLSDLWETQGVDVDKDGVVDLRLDLAPYNADPNHRDLFVEMDYMTCTLSPGGCAGDDRTSQAPQPGTVADVIAAYAAAPLMNPDGTTGIRLHLDVDEPIAEIKALPFTSVVGPDNDFEDIRSGGVGACDGRFGTPAERADPTCPKLIRAKAVVYRYGIWAHSYVYPFMDPKSSGIAEMPGNDFIISTGIDVTVWTNAAGSLRAAEAGTLMHELGHTLGLNHGGKGDADNCKSNYLSVMNYALQVPSYDPTRPLDYSRSILPSLSEVALVESAGVGGPNGRFTVYKPRVGNPRVAPADGPIDWNNDGDTLDTVSQNTNDFCVLLGTRPDQILRGAEDWSRLVYSFTAYPDFAPGSRFSTEELLGQELASTDAEQAAEDTDFDADGIPNSTDVCPAVADAAQTDTDGDGLGDACDSDSFAPTAAPTSAPPPNAAGWNKTNVTVTWHWTDESGGSGIDPEHCSASSVSTGEGAAVVVAATCADLAGHTGTATRVVKVDKTAPVIVCPTSQRRVLNTTGATLTATVTDAGGSGVASASITVAVPTTVAGARSVAVAATDRAGNASSVTCAYQVTYKVVWLIPVAGPSSPMSVLRNTVVPFTFRLVDAKGSPVNSATVSVPTAVVTACPSGATPRVVSLSGNAVTKKLGDGWWLAGWKAQTAWKGTCRLVTIGLSDGTSITAILKVD